jgi:hypothetical protein
MNPHELASLDGRYFGPLPIASIAGLAEPLWTSAQDRSWGLSAPARRPVCLSCRHSSGEHHGSHDTHYRPHPDDGPEDHARTELAPVGRSTVGILSVGPAPPQVLKSMEDAVRAARDTQPNTVGTGSVSPACRAHLDPSRRRCSPHAPTSPRPHAGSRSSASCAEPPPARKETRTAAPLRPGTDRGSGPITALPTWFWRQLPKATHPISGCQPGQEMTPAKSALQGIPHHPTRRRRRLHPPRRTTMNAPARAPSFRSWRSPPTVRRASVPQATGPPSNRRSSHALAVIVFGLPSSSRTGAPVASLIEIGAIRALTLFAGHISRVGRKMYA